MPEMDYEDYAGFTWGGEGTLQGSSYKMSGEYVCLRQIFYHLSDLMLLPNFFDCLHLFFYKIIYG